MKIGMLVLAVVVLSAKAESQSSFQSNSPPTPEFRSEQWDVPPKVLKSAEPNFSPEALVHRIGGKVVVRAFIDDQGKVRKTVIVSGIGYGLDKEAQKSVRQYVFTPALKDGKAVACNIVIGVNFKIL